MKWNVKMLAMAMAVAFAATGCSGGAAKEEKDPLAILAKSEEVMAGVTSMNALMEMQIAMNMGGEELSMVTNADISTTMEPLQMKMTMTADMGGQETANMEMYAVEEGGKVMSYMNVEGQWYQSTIDMAEFGQYNAEENINMYLNGMEDAVISGEDVDINGVMTTRIDGVIRGEKMQQMVETSGALDSAGAGVLSAEDMKAIFAEIGDLDISLWIGEDGYVYKYEMDMAQMMQSVMQKTLETLGADTTTEEGKVEISKAYTSMTCSDYNAVEAIEVPAEATASAQPVA